MKAKQAIITGIFCAASGLSQAATVTTFNNASGLIFEGTFVRAVNVSGDGAAHAPDVVINGVTYGDAYYNTGEVDEFGDPIIVTNGVPGVSVALNDSSWGSNYGTLPNYGGGADNIALGAMMADAAIPVGGEAFSVFFNGLTVGATYNLYILASNNHLSSDQTSHYQLFDFESGLVLDSTSLDLTALQGGSANTGVLIRLQGVANESGELSFGVSGPTSPTYVSGMVLTAVPEPSAALLGGFGALALLLRRRRD